MHLAAHASTELRRGRELPDGSEGERLQRRIGGDTLAIRLIPAAADDARASSALDVRQIPAHRPSLAKRTTQSRIATDDAAERDLQSGAAEGRDLQREQLHRQLPGPKSTRETDTALRDHVASARRRIIELNVRVHQHRVGRSADDDVPVERAGSLQLE